MARTLILISGYYGFDNLGDEAILEQLISEVKSATNNSDSIVVLSNDPKGTREKFGVASVNRWRMLAMPALMAKTRLFISGGGGLFQDTQSIKSVVYYGALIAQARSLGAKTLVYAQGLGPLKSQIGQSLTKRFLSFAQTISVRDQSSFSLLESWNLHGQKTADPVWALAPTALPEEICHALTKARGVNAEKKLIGLSLRSGAGFTQTHLRELVKALHQSLGSESTIVLLPLQKEQDQPLLAAFSQEWQKLGRTSIFLPLEELKLPSQWLSLIGSLDFVIGMRLHSLIMALASGKPVIGIAYDPKVESVLSEFEQANLAFTKHSEEENDCSNWSRIIGETVARESELAGLATVKAAQCRQMACQNGALIAKILSK